MSASANKLGKILRVLANLAAINLALRSCAVTGFMLAFFDVHRDLLASVWMPLIFWGVSGGLQYS
jgi:hypothetical protein